MPRVISSGKPRLANACADLARCLSLNASRLARAAARSSCFDRSVGKADIQRKVLRVCCHHPRKRVIRYSRDASAKPGSYGALNTPLEPVIGRPEGETRWRGMTRRLVTTNYTTKKQCEAADSREPLAP